MFKDYYRILGVSQNATPPEIKAAYRTMSMKWHPDKNPDQDVIAIMQNINEAYAILKDPDKRSRYDCEYNNFKQRFYQPHNTEEKTHSKSSRSSWEYDYNVRDEAVREDIKNARSYAEKIVAEFMASFKQATHNAAKGAWDGAKGYVWVAIILTVLVLLIQLCSSANSKSLTDSSVIEESPALIAIESNGSDASSSGAEIYSTPDGWTTYYVDNNSFTISVPPSVELRSNNDQYVKRLRDLGVAVNTDNVIFQQKGLANSRSGMEDKHYCRIMIAHARCQPGDVYKRNETELIAGDLKSELLEMASAELAPGQIFLETPSVRWIDVNNAKAIEIKYRRSGNKGNTTRCYMYLFFNYDEFVKMIIAYREQEADLWDSDMKKLIYTFTWK